MAGGSITGVVGKITWFYYSCAAINGYVVTRSADNTWTLSATVVQRNDYNLRQRPLFFVAPTDKGDWRWPIVAITEHAEPNQLRATLGPPVP